MSRHSDITGLLVLGGIVGLIVIAAKIFGALERHIKVEAEKRSKSIFESKKFELIKIVEEREKKALKEILDKSSQLEIKEKYLVGLRDAFQKDFMTGRRWLSSFISEADKVNDELIINYLKVKKHPAHQAAEIVSIAKAERREAIKAVKFLQYQLETYKEYFPILEEYEEIILNERINFHEVNNESAIENIDKTSLFLSQEEYNTFSVTDRNQLALDRYISRTKENWEIGRLYERYLGSKYENEKWHVEYLGALKGFEDMGRDLICRKDGKIHIVQAKCWSSKKTIHEKHIFQLFGTALCYEMENNLLPGVVSAVFTTTANLSSVALAAANKLGIAIKQVPLNQNYPMIKCNINQGEKIYHLPFDQQYDRVKIVNDGEFYALTVQEAEKKGFRRAMRYLGTK